MLALTDTMHHVRELVAVIALVALVGGCARQSEGAGARTGTAAPHALEEETTAATTAAPTAAPAAKAATTTAATTQTTPKTGVRTPAVHIEVQKAEGLPADRIRMMFANAAEPLAGCLPGGSGKIIVRVTGTSNGKIQVAVDPSVTGLKDPAAARACAEGTLSTVYLEQTGSNAGGPAVPPSGFTSLLTVAW